MESLIKNLNNTLIKNLDKILIINKNTILVRFLQESCKNLNKIYKTSKIYIKYIYKIYKIKELITNS